MRVKLPLSLVIISLLLSIGIGCSRAPNDSQIISDVQSKIQADSAIQSKQQVAVQSSSGVVVLSGTVGNEAEKALVAADAGQVSGVKTIINNLQVAAATAAATAPGPEPTSVETPKVSARKSATPPRQTAAAKPREYSDAPPAAPVAPAAPRVQPVTIADGTTVSVRLTDELDSEKAQVGDTFHASLSAPLTADGVVAVPAGSDVQGRVVAVQSAGHFKGQSLLAIELTSLNSGGKSYEIRTTEYRKEGSSRGKRTAATVGGGAALGAIIGGLAGGGKGAAIGAGVGAGAGTGVQAVTKGQQILLPSETALNFQLSSALSVIPSAGRNAGRPRVE